MFSQSSLTVSHWKKREIKGCVLSNKKRTDDSESTSPLSSWLQILACNSPKSQHSSPNGRWINPSTLLERWFSHRRWWGYSKINLLVFLRCLFVSHILSPPCRSEISCQSSLAHRSTCAVYALFTPHKHSVYNAHGLKSSQAATG